MMRVELRSRPSFANSHLQQLLHGFENKTFLSQHNPYRWACSLKRHATIGQRHGNLSSWALPGYICSGCKGESWTELCQRLTHQQTHTRVDVPVFVGFFLVSPRNGLCTTAYTRVIHSPAVHIFPVRRSNYTHVQLNSPAGIIGCKLNTQSPDTIYCIKQKFGR